MPNSLTSSVVGFVVVSALVTGASSSVAADRAAESSRTVYVTAIDKKGNAVTDLQAAEFEVKVGGKKLEVISAGPAQAPMRIALLVADAGTGGFQGGLATFIQKLLGHAEFALISVLVQPETVVDYSSASRPNSTTTKLWKARTTLAWCSATVPGNQEGATTRLCRRR